MNKANALSMHCWDQTSTLVFPLGVGLRGHPCVWGWAPIHPRPGIGFGQKLINKFICTTAHSGKVFFFLCNTRIQNRRKESSDLDIRSQKDGGPWGHVDRVPYKQAKRWGFYPLCRQWWGPQAK